MDGAAAQACRTQNSDHSSPARSPSGAALEQLVPASLFGPGDGSLRTTHAPGTRRSGGGWVRKGLQKRIDQKVLAERVKSMLVRCTQVKVFAAMHTPTSTVGTRVGV